MARHRLVTLRMRADCIEALPAAVLVFRHTSRHPMLSRPADMAGLQMADI